MARASCAQTWEEFAKHNPDLLIWKGGVLTTLYRQETLDYDLARYTFVLPDQACDVCPGKKLQVWNFPTPDTRDLTPDTCLLEAAPLRR